MSRTAAGRDSETSDDARIVRYLERVSDVQSGSICRTMKLPRADIGRIGFSFAKNVHQMSRTAAGRDSETSDDALLVQ